MSKLEKIVNEHLFQLCAKMNSRLRKMEENQPADYQTLVFFLEKYPCVSFERNGIYLHEKQLLSSSEIDSFLKTLWIEHGWKLNAILTCLETFEETWM